MHKLTPCGLPSFVRPTTGGCFLATTLFILVVLIAWVQIDDVRYDSIGLSSRSKYYSRSDNAPILLDRRLGSGAKIPEELAKVLSLDERSSENLPYNILPEELGDVKVQALLQLIALQETFFGRDVSPTGNAEVAFEVPVVRVLEKSKAGVLLLATTSAYPDYFEMPWEGYFYFELVSVKWDGRILSRRYYRGNANY